MNWLAVGIGAMAYYIIGAFWYTILSKPWMRAIGKTREELQGNAWRGYAMALVAAVLTCSVMAEFMNVLNTTGALPGAVLGLLAWLGFVFAPTANHTTFGGRSKLLFVIDQGYDLVGFVIAGALIAAFR